MARTSINKSKGSGAPPALRSEQEEAEWLASPAGREDARRSFQKAIRKGKIVVNEKMSILEASKLATATGKAIVLRNGPRVKRSDPAVLHNLLEEARGLMTKSISLRLPQRDLDAAKRIAERRGVGYQTVLKQIIAKGLEQAS